PLAVANRKKHEITLIANSLAPETVYFAEGKDAVVVFTNDLLDKQIIDKLADYGIRYIATRSVATNHIDRVAAAGRNIKVANVPHHSQNSTAEHTLAIALALNRKIIPAGLDTRNFDYSLDGLTNFNFHEKTVGIIGCGVIGKQVAQIFKGLGCHVMVNDIILNPSEAEFPLVSLEKLLATADIVSIHIPSNEENRYLVNKETIAKMKTGVMLLNTSGNDLVDISAVHSALKDKKIGYFGSSISEKDGELFFNTDHNDESKSIIKELRSLKNVILSPQQTFLTHEALQEIATQTIRNLDNWHLNKCTGKACACLNHCRKDEVILEKLALNNLL
ncbi:MAG: 2-hydroxyacid dehydrogenase, partial [Pedobacter sp.]